MIERPRRGLTLLACVLLVAACGGTTPSGSATAPTAGPATPGPVGSGLPSMAPASEPPGSEIPTTAPSPSPGPDAVLAPGTAVEVVASELNLRRNPTTGAKRVSLLTRGDVLVISPLDNLQFGWGPVRANGFDWYPVVQVSTPDGRLPRLPEHPVDPADGAPVSGWVAAGEGSKPYLRALPARCPAVPDLASVSGMLPAERLSCFGTTPIVLEGVFGCSGCGGVIVGTFKPEWLAVPAEFDFLSVDPNVRFGPLAVRFPPGGPTPPAAGSIVRVTVHVHDPRSAECRIVEGEGASAEKVPQATAELFCRERLVVDALEVIGTDPDFPSG